jgi:hypothetical protein
VQSKNFYCEFSISLSSWNCKWAYSNSEAPVIWEIKTLTLISKLVKRREEVWITFEPCHDKANIVRLQPAWIQTSLRIRTYIYYGPMALLSNKYVLLLIFIIYYILLNEKLRNIDEIKCVYSCSYFYCCVAYFPYFLLQWNIFSVFSLGSCPVYFLLNSANVQN